MPVWLVPFLWELVRQGLTTYPEILAIARSNGMTPAQEAEITTGYAAMIAQAEIDAGKK